MVLRLRKPTRNTMGIKSLNQFLRSKCPEIFESINLEEYRYQKVAIDISLYMHKFKAIWGDQWLGAFIGLIASLRRNELHCVFVFDGKSPPEKLPEQLRRRAERAKLEEHVYALEEALDEYYKNSTVGSVLIDLHKRRKSPKKRLLGKTTAIDMDWVIKRVQQKQNQLIDVDSSDFELTKELFQILKVPFLTAPGEAEKMCAKMCTDGLVAAVLSEDTDVIAYAAPVFLTRIDTSADLAVRICHEDVVRELGLSKSQLLDLCIMCGTDYNSNIFRTGAHTAYKKIKALGGIDEIAKNTDLDVSVLKHVRCRELFTIFEDYGISSVPYCGRHPDFDLLWKFIEDNQVWTDPDKTKEVNDSTRQKRFEKVRKDLTHADIIFEDEQTEDGATLVAPE